MSKTAMVRARMEPSLKQQAEEILAEVGLSPTQAITLFYRQIELSGGLPFEIRIPNETTLMTFRATDEGRDLMVCENTGDLFRRLGI